MSLSLNHPSLILKASFIIFFFIIGSNLIGLVLSLFITKTIHLILDTMKFKIMTNPYLYIIPDIVLHSKEYDTLGHLTVLTNIPLLTRLSALFIV